MFSFGSPFGYEYEYARPKQSPFGLFDDDPFSSGYYVREQRPSLFRSSSFRQPTRYCYEPTYQPSYQQCRQTESQKSSDDEEYDPFLSLFGMPTSTRPNNKKKQQDVRSNEVKSNEVKSNEVKSNESSKRQTKSATPKIKSPIVEQQQIKELDSQRFDEENEIIYRFNNYKCENPSGISVTITKDSYIVLKTDDGYMWKCRLPDQIDVSKASCTCLKNVLSLRLPRQPAVKSEDQINNSKVTNDVNMEESNDDKKEEPKMEHDKNSKTEIKDDEFDPDAPIVEDILDDDIYN